MTLNMDYCNNEIGDNPVNTSWFFVDTSGWFAYLDERDDRHKDAVKEIQERLNSVLTSDYTLSELTHAEQSRLDNKAIASFVWQIWEKQEKKLIRATEDDESIAWKIFCQYHGSRPTFTDCINVVLLKKYKINSWLSFNKWFPKTLKELEMLV